MRNLAQKEQMNNEIHRCCIVKGLSTTAMIYTAYSATCKVQSSPQKPFCDLFNSG